MGDISGPGFSPIEVLPPNLEDLVFICDGELGTLTLTDCIECARQLLRAKQQKDPKLWSMKKIVMEGKGLEIKMLESLVELDAHVGVSFGYCVE